MVFSKVCRIAFLSFMAACLNLFPFAQEAQPAENFPTRPVDLMVPMPPGGGLDKLARKISPLLEQYFRMPFPVGNYLGAAGNVAMHRLTTSRPDGYLVSISSGAILCTWSAVQIGDYTPEDFTWLARLMKQPSALIAKYDSPIKDASDMIRLAKEKQLTVAIQGVGTLDDISVRYLAVKGGLNLKPIVFARPAERYAAVLGGHTDLLYKAAGDVRHFLEAKKLRVIMFYSKNRSEFYPEIPTSYELGYKIGFPSWRGLNMHKDTPKEIVKTLEKGLMHIANQPDYTDWLKREKVDADSFVAGDEHYNDVVEQYKLLIKLGRELGIRTD